MATTITAGFNEPGYLPNPDTIHEFDTIKDAWQYLADEVRHDQADLSSHLHYPEDSLEREILDFDACQLEKFTNPGEVHLANVVFWVSVV